MRPETLSLNKQIPEWNFCSTQERNCGMLQWTCVQHYTKWPKHVAEWLSPFPSPPTAIKSCPYILDSCSRSSSAHVIVRNAYLAILTSTHSTHCSSNTRFPVGSARSSFSFSTSLPPLCIPVCLSEFIFSSYSFSLLIFKISLHILDRNPLLDM